MGTLDLVLDRNSEQEAIDPPWLLWKGRASDAAKAEYFEKLLPIRQRESEDRIDTAMNNLLWYTGEYEKTAEYRIVVPGQGEQVVPRKLVPRIFNQLYEVTEQRVSRLSRYRADFEVVPTNQEESDRVRARLLDTALQAFSRRERLDDKIVEIERWNAVFGECLVTVDWDKTIGDRSGYRSLDRIGDVSLTFLEPWRYFPEPRSYRKDVTYMIVLRDVIHIEEARVRFKKKSLEPDNKTSILAFNQDMYEKRTDEVCVWELIQRPTQYLPEGAYTTFCAGQLVEEADAYPYSHLEFPFEWYTDIDVPGRLFPMSFYQHLKPIQHCYNRLTSLMVRNTLLTQHPHILLPEGSAKIEAFANSPSVIRYNPISGAKPEVVTFKGLNQETLTLWGNFKDEIIQLAGNNGVSRGTPPAGTRATGMLRFYEEQEEQRATSSISKHNELIRQIYKKAASVMCDYYPEGPKERLIRVVGHENEYLIDEFIGAKISSEYDVIIINSTGFSRSMAGRLEEVERIQSLPQATGQAPLLSPQQMADVLELKNPQKAYDVMTASLKFADMNCEIIMNAKKPPSPETHWDFIVHWQQTMIMMNSPKWARVPDTVRALAKDHILALEMLMADKAAANIAFAQHLGTLELFPVEYTLEPAPPDPTQQASGQQQQPAPGPQDQQMLPPPPNGSVPPDAGVPLLSGPQAGVPQLPPQVFAGEAIGAQPPTNPVNPLLGMV